MFWRVNSCHIHSFQVSVFFYRWREFISGGFMPLLPTLYAFLFISILTSFWLLSLFLFLSNTGYPQTGKICLNWSSLFIEPILRNAHIQITSDWRVRNMKKLVLICYTNDKQHFTDLISHRNAKCVIDCNFKTEFTQNRIFHM